jgi:hypothetical protein
MFKKGNSVLRGAFECYYKFKYDSLFENDFDETI